MNAHVYQINHERFEKEIITLGRKFVQFNAFMHTACTCTIMATALQNSLCIPNMKPPQHIQNGQDGKLKFSTQ